LVVHVFEHIVVGVEFLMLVLLRYFKLVFEQFLQIFLLAELNAHLDGCVV